MFDQRPIALWEAAACLGDFETLKRIDIAGHLAELERRSFHITVERYPREFSFSETMLQLLAPLLWWWVDAPGLRSLIAGICAAEVPEPIVDLGAALCAAAIQEPGDRCDRALFAAFGRRAGISQLQLKIVNVDGFGATLGHLAAFGSRGQGDGCSFQELLFMIACGNIDVVRALLEYPDASLNSLFEWNDLLQMVGQFVLNDETRRAQTLWTVLQRGRGGDALYGVSLAGMLKHARKGAWEHYTTLIGLPFPLDADGLEKVENALTELGVDRDEWDVIPPRDELIPLYESIPSDDEE
jgi:hypothetical protein